MAADWVQLAGGVDPAEGLRNGYTTAEEAAALLEARGLDGLPALASAHLGVPIRPLEAALGDVAVVPVEGAACWPVALGIVSRTRVAVPMARGIGWIGLDCAEAAWRLPGRARVGGGLRCLR